MLLAVALALAPTLHGLPRVSAAPTTSEADVNDLCRDGFRYLYGSVPTYLAHDSEGREYYTYSPTGTGYTLVVPRVIRLEWRDYCFNEDEDSYYQLHHLDQECAGKDINDDIAIAIRRGNVVEVDDAVCGPLRAAREAANPSPAVITISAAEVARIDRQLEREHVRRYNADCTDSGDCDTVPLSTSLEDVPTKSGTYTSDFSQNGQSYRVSSKRAGCQSETLDTVTECIQDWANEAGNLTNADQAPAETADEQATREAAEAAARRVLEEREREREERARLSHGPCSDPNAPNRPSYCYP